MGKIKWAKKPLQLITGMAGLAPTDPEHQAHEPLHSPHFAGLCTAKKNKFLLIKTTLKNERNILNNIASYLS